FLRSLTPPPTPFPYTTLFRSLLISHCHMDHLQGFPFFVPSYNPHTRIDIHLAPRGSGHPLSEPFHRLMEEPTFPVPFHQPVEWLDRKSTRLNSSHGSISYAVF